MIFLLQMHHTICLFYFWFTLFFLWVYFCHENVFLRLGDSVYEVCTLHNLISIHVIYRIWAFDVKNFTRLRDNWNVLGVKDRLWEIPKQALVRCGCHKTVICSIFDKSYAWNLSRVTFKSTNNGICNQISQLYSFLTRNDLQSILVIIANGKNHGRRHLLLLPFQSFRNLTFLRIINDVFVICWD